MSGLESRERTLTRRPDGTWRGAFVSMASPCELLARTESETAARSALERVSEEAWRIERKFSRYRDDSVIAEIHRSRGRGITLDEESTRLFDYAHQMWVLSCGAFDITSGVLRRVWSFGPGAELPDPAEVRALLPLVGWSQVEWDPPKLRLPRDMEIDLGGIGKEYAVDRAAEALLEHPGDFLVNLGGDLRVVSSRKDGRPVRERYSWTVGIESPVKEGAAALRLGLDRGALATSGDAKRSLVRDGVRYGHVLDPRTGWPVPGAPRSVTVHAHTCVEAGSLATVAILHGAGAESFLEGEGVPHWCAR